MLQFVKSLVVFFLLIIACPVIAQNFEMKWRSDDTRLEKHITIQNPRIALGNLLEQLTIQSGVPFVTDYRDSSSGTVVTVYLKDAPLSQVMDNLWSLLSLKNAGWEWDRIGRKGSYAYRFLPTENASKLAVYWSKERYAYYLANCKLMMEMAKMTPEERTRNRDRLSASLLQSDNRVADAWLNEKGLAYQRSWIGIRLFNALSSDVQMHVLNGLDERVNVDKLSEEGRAWVHTEWSTHPVKISTNGGPLTQVPEPTWIRFYVNGGKKDHRTVAPTFFIEMQEMGAFSYMGGLSLDFGIANRIFADWLQKGDSETNLIADKITAARSDTEPAEPIQPKSFEEMMKMRMAGKQFDDPHIIEKRLRQLSEAAPLSLMALLTEDQKPNPSEPYKMTVQQFLDKTENREPNRQLSYKFRHKWRNETLLVMDPGYFLGDVKYPPYELVRQLRRVLKAGDGFLSVNDLVQVFSTLDSDTLQSLIAEFPVLNIDRNLVDLFTVTAAFPAINRSNGAQVNNDLVNQLSSMSSLLKNSSLVNGRATAIRWVTINSKLDGIRKREIRFEYYGPLKKWVPFNGFTQVEIPKDSVNSVKVEH